MNRKIENVACYWSINGSMANLDATIVYKIQHILFTDGTAHSEYGGFQDEWLPFEGFQVLDLNVPGVLIIPGREWMACKGDTFDQFEHWMNAHA